MQVVLRLKSLQLSKGTLDLDPKRVKCNLLVDMGEKKHADTEDMFKDALITDCLHFCNKDVRTTSSMSDIKFVLVCFSFLTLSY